MKQTVFISVHTRTSSSIFRTDFNSERSEAGKLLAFLESKKLDDKIFNLHKEYQFNPATQFWLPHFNLFECEKTCESLCGEIENGK